MQPLLLCAPTLKGAGWPGQGTPRPELWLCHTGSGRSIPWAERVLTSSQNIHFPFLPFQVLDAEKHRNNKQVISSPPLLQLGCHTVLLPEHVPPGHTSPSVVTLTPSVLCSSPQASSPHRKKTRMNFQDILPGKRHFWALEFFLGWFPRGHLGLQLLCVDPERKEPWACRGPWAKAQAHHGGWASHPHPGSRGLSQPLLCHPETRTRGPASLPDKG